MTHPKFLLSSLVLACLSAHAPAYTQSALNLSGKIINLAPQPVTCMASSFANAPGGNKYYTEVDITLTNNCGSPVNLRDATLTFTNSAALKTNGWGTFNTVSYPSSMSITSQLISKGVYTASYNLVFSTADWVVTELPAGSSVVLKYGVNSLPGYTASSAQVYLPANTPQQTGTLALTNSTAKPADISQAYAIVNLAINGVSVKSVNLPWAGSLNVTGLSTGIYTLQPQSLTDSSGNTYQGTANPSSITVTANQTVNSAVSYTEIAKNGSITIQAPALPSALSGYTGSPSIIFTTSSGSTVTQTVPWNVATTVTQLANTTNYTFSTPSISFNGSNCSGSFSPASATASSTSAASTTLSYQCATVTQDKIALTVSGAPATTGTVNITFTPSNDAAATVQAVTLVNGSGTANVMLTDGVVYNVSASSVSGYNAAVNPSSFTAKANATETVTYSVQPAVSGRLATYVPGWETPPPATQLAAAGYTHVMVAFGVFSTTNPGQLVSAFDTVTTTYIQQLHAAGIKVLLSIGGASTSLANTTVSFDQVLQAASSPAAFETALVQSIESFVTQYGFDGVDFDIEQGFNPSGTFLKPTGDIAALAAVINQLRAANPNMLITLVPQAANVAPDPQFSSTWDNYASLISQVGPSLSWVQIQLYNTGSVYGIDMNLYTPTTSPDFSVAMATALLAAWPATVNGQATNFNPYNGPAYLNASQVGIGYPAPNASGASDGTPVTPVATIKRAIECLRTGVKSATSCDTFVPPTTYPSFGTVFNWEATYDESNGYAFAEGLSACIFQGNC